MDPVAEALAALEQHYQVHLGPPRGDAPWETTEGPIGLRRFEPVPGTLVLATVGVSQIHGNAPEAVLSMHGQPPEATLVRACQILGAFAEQSTPDLARYPLALEGVDFETVLVLPPLPFTEGLARLRQPAPMPPLEIRWLLPAFDDEAEYAHEHGPEALLNLLRAQRLDAADFSRAPASTLVTPEDAARMAGASGADADKSYKAEQVRGGIRIERKRRKIGRSTAATNPPGPMVSPPPPTPKAAPKPPPPRSRPARRATEVGRKPGRKQFELGRPPPPPTPTQPAVRTAPAAPEDPADAKRKRVEALRAKVREARVRAEARARGDAVEAAPAPTPAPNPADKARSVQAAERRRGRRGQPDPRRR